MSDYTNLRLKTNILLTLVARTYTLNAVRYTLICNLQLATCNHFRLKGENIHAKRKTK